MILTVASLAEIEPLLTRARAAADWTAQAVRHLVDTQSDGVEVLRHMKFEEMARHPLGERPLNLVEQINQTWTCLVSLRASQFLLARHPDAGGFRLNLGTSAGTDIESITPGLVAADSCRGRAPIE